MPGCCCRPCWPATWISPSCSISTSTLEAEAGRANPGDKVLTLIMSSLAGGDCIDVAALRAGATSAVLGHRGPAPSMSLAGSQGRCHGRQALVGDETPRQPQLGVGPPAHVEIRPPGTGPPQPQRPECRLVGLEVSLPTT